MREITTETLIIGAGPAGLACALELAKGDEDFIILEKESGVGGLSRTYTFDENGAVFRTDNGPHRFFSKNPYLYTFIGEILADDWITVKRQTRQFIDGKFYAYPIDFRQALSNIGVLRAAWMMLGYLAAQVRFRLLRRTIRNFEEYVVAHFGRPLGEFNMINYTEKIWGMPSSQIHADWASQRIKGLNMRSIIAGALRALVGKKPTGEGPKTLVDTFYYPRLGTGLIYDTIAKGLRADGYEIFCNADVKRVEHTGGRLTSVVADVGGKPIRIRFRNLVESIPLPTFVRLLSPSAPRAVLALTSKLRYRSQVYLFITFNKDRITDDQWIYFPSKDIPFARVSEMKNFSAAMAPPGKTSLFIEFFCDKGDAIWNMSDTELFELALPHFERIGFFARADVRRYYVVRKTDVYPIYDLDYKTYLGAIKHYFDAFDNLFYIGRPGRFRYNNQDHSLEMGIAAAESIIDGRRRDIDAIGSSQEYYEAGKVPAPARSAP